MSMILELRRVSTSEAEALAADPSDILWFLTGIESDRPSGLFPRLFSRRQTTRSSREWVEPAEGTVVDLDKAWHGIHFLLTGEAWGGELPAASLLSGGLQLGAEDVGYGPARLLRPSEVQAFSDHLQRITEMALAERFDGPAMQAAEIYPDIWDSPDELGYLRGYFEKLRDFVRDTAAAGEALVIHLS